MVVRMSDNYVDPSGNTEAFRAFTKDSAGAHRAVQDSADHRRRGGAVVLIALIVWLVS